MRQWQITFFQKGAAPTDTEGVFGCCVSGVSCANSEESNANRLGMCNWGISPYGEVLSGTYAQVLKDLEKLTDSGFAPHAVLVFFSRGLGAEAFLRAMTPYISGVPVVGGGAAVDSETGYGQIIPPAEDVAVLLIHDSRYVFHHVWENIHEPSGETVSFRAGGERILLAIRDEDKACDISAQDWYSAKKKTLSLREESFENLAFSTPGGWNMHASPEGAFALKLGANLPGNGKLAIGVISDKIATEKIKAFCWSSQVELYSLIFGCSGLQTLLTEEISVPHHTLAGFFHGEVLMAEGLPRFTNLMMSKLLAEQRGG